MDLKEIQNLIRFVAKSGASEVKLEMDDVKITIKTGTDEDKGATTIVQQMPTMAPVQQAPAQPVAQPAETVAPAAATPAEDDNSKYITIKSPIIGTFYRKPSPDKPTFVEVGKSISEGDVLCGIVRFRESV